MVGQELLECFPPQNAHLLSFASASSVSAPAFSSSESSYSAITSSSEFSYDSATTSSVEYSS